MARPRKHEEPQWTAAQDAIILNSKGPGEYGLLAGYARQWGVSRYVVYRRRQALQAGEARSHSAEAQSPRRRGFVPAPFARPAWFEEDLFAMTKGAVR